jgi:methanogenic corrinoid protein MtbC1
MTQGTAHRLRSEIDERLAARDRAGAVLAALEAVDSGGVTIPELYTSVLTPLLVETGNAWQRGDVEIWEEHLATQTVRTIVEALYPKVVAESPEPAPDARSALFACPPEEHHDIGLRMLADRFELSGWRVVYLGANTPGDQVVGAAREVGADAVVMTASTHFHKVRLRDLTRELGAELPDVTVWVGGAAFIAENDDWDPDELLNPADILGDAEASGGRPGDPSAEGPR